MKRRTRALRTTVTLSLLAAMSIICGKYLAFGVGQVLRFSFENLPIMLSGMLLGPVAGMLTGAVADLVGCALVGYAVNPLVTLGAVAIGGVSGACYALLGRLPRLPLCLRLSLSVAASHLIGSVLIKTVGLVIYYPMPLYVLMLWRLLNYVIIGILEYVILYALMRNKALRAALGGGQS